MQALSTTQSKKFLSAMNQAGLRYLDSCFTQVPKTRVVPTSIPLFFAVFAAGMYHIDTRFDGLSRQFDKFDPIPFVLAPTQHHSKHRHSKMTFPRFYSFPCLPVSPPSHHLPSLALPCLPPQDC
eukprot:GDKI01033059.1.p1 GENE.GDKI01033059.1~~GDKI01033059.1.p1  ORF type:complete len:124 (+),score=5.19 GDKI01033059.1:142-513(+)